ncbi:MAG TPA: DUF2255 family protein [Stellaceae bacterium]|nr:DUF2255 family protein [Stellaceae bacterium]
MVKLDAETLCQLREVHEISVRTVKHPNTPVVIWAVVADEEVFVRSVYGARGRWYRDLRAGGAATLEFAGRTVPVQAIPETDPAAIERASGEFLRKYRPSPYAPAMVKSEILSTTLRLEPR